MFMLRSIGFPFAWEAKMRTIIGVVAGTFCLASLAVPAWAETQTITPADAKTHVGQTVTVEGAVGNIATGRSGTVFIDVGGRYPDNGFAAVIFASDRSKFPDLKTLDGKTVAITGTVSLYQGKPEIILKSADQMQAK
jgi:DNA/RNA endonuclease YhcR with UshA esterase domain